MNLFKIALSLIKKRKSSAITFFSIIIMSALVLSTSLSLLFNSDSFYDSKRQQLNSGDILMTVPHSSWNSQMPAYLDSYASITDYEISEIYVGEMKYYSKPSSKNRHQFFVGSSSDMRNRTINKVSLIDEMTSKPAAYAFLPLIYRGGFKTGDTVFLESASTTYALTVVGFFEDAQCGSSTMGIKNVFIDTQSYQTLATDPSFFASRVIAAQFKTPKDAHLFQTDFTKNFRLDSGGVVVLMYDQARAAHTLFPLIMSFVLLIVAAIVLVIALIIVRFNIATSIEEDIKTLGALKSIGFTSRQIILTMLLQFFAIAAAGSIIGVILGGLASGFVGNAVTATSGLLWNNSTFFVSAIIAAVAILCICALTTFLAAAKSKKITPIVALRGNQTQSAKKNYAPLSKTRLPLNLALAAKSFFGSIKNNITAFVVVTLFAFMTVLGFTLHNNFVVDTSAFVQMLGLEPAQIQMEVFDAAEISILNELEADADVAKLVRFRVFSTVSNGITVPLCAWENISKKERNTIISGRYPTHDTEVSLLSSAINALGKRLGDKIIIEYDGAQQEYKIVGITQGVSGDVSSDITHEGFKRLKSDAVLKSAFIYLSNTNSAFVDGFVNAMRVQYGSKIYAVNYSELINSTLIALSDPISIVTYLIVAINLATIVFVFFLLINTIIRRKNRDLGILKALGFTTKQLVIQLLLSFLPSILLGIALGSLLGALLTNPILSIMFGGLGIVKAIFEIPALITFIMQLVILLVCVATICLIAQKIKKIAPQKLLTE